ncbi:MAG: hypothetical protein IIU11_04520, partial [Bacteroidales bacterium]|nr:hypothetical protein [Bacteroidales bacterium]
DYYVSTNATVNMNAPLKVGSIGYISGSYNATLQSGTGDSKKVINITGEFNCPAYNSTQQ